jgi:hypothetical protein
VHSLFDFAGRHREHHAAGGSFEGKNILVAEPCARTLPVDETARTRMKTLSDGKIPNN